MKNSLRALTILICIALTTPCFSNQTSHARKDKESELLKNFKRSVSTDTKPQFRILKSLSFASKEYKLVNDQFHSKYTYPQGFYIDEENDFLFILRYSNNRPAQAVIEKYQWHSGSLITNYVFPERQTTISEGLIVDSSPGETLAYIRSDNKLTRFRLVEKETKFGTAEKLTYLYDQTAQSFYRKGGLWYVEKYTSDKNGPGHSRGEYDVLDRGFKCIKSISFPAEYTGYRESEKLNMPKHQGFAVLDKGFVMSMGGYWSTSTKTTPFHYYGINTFDENGKISNSKYLAPQTLFAQLSSLGVDASRIENEGIQALEDGTLVALQVVHTETPPKDRLLFIGFDPL
ncbi:hypothetical protein [Pseudomonas sp.]|uniref:hypothetical protein n=1 Tax=Pseudomonas sp. TaxID=306 RepID=UPI0028AC6B02|nr:hypothetical protein [Pseudomonas sp.]